MSAFASNFIEHTVWWKRFESLTWSKTIHQLKARTPKEVESKLVRIFKNAGLSGMSLVAVPTGQDPNL